MAIAFRRVTLVSLLATLTVATVALPVVASPVAAAPSGPTIPGGGGTPQAGSMPHSAQPAVPSTPDVAPPSGYSVRGIDVSAYQGNVNWGAAANAGIKFAYVKATEGTTYTNPYFNGQYNGAKNNGLFAGAYAFARPDEPNAKAQADYFVNNAQWRVDGRTLPLMLDLEWPYSGSGVSNACWGLSPAAMVNWIHTFVTEARARTGKPMLIYTSPYWWNPCTNSSRAFADQWLNIPYWNPGPPTYLPAGWSRWTIWQYDDAGSQPGDQDVFNGSLAQMAAWAGTNPAGVSVPATVSSGPGHVAVFFKGADGTLWQKAYTASNGQGWQWQPAAGSGSLGGNPIVAAPPDGIVDAFWRGTNAALWHMWFVDGRWFGPASMGGSMVGDPAVAATGNGNLDVFYTGTDGQLWHRSFRGAWRPAEVLSAGRVSHSPRAVGYPDGSVEVYWRGNNNVLYFLRWTPSGWSRAGVLAGGLSSDPAPVTSSPGVTDVFYRGGDGGLWHSWRSGSAWSGPQGLNAGRLGSGPAAAAQSSGVIDVFWMGTNRQLWHKWYMRGWWGPQSLGGTLDTPPTATAQSATGIVDVFYNNSIRSLGHSWYIGRHWWGPETQGGFLS